SPLVAGEAALLRGTFPSLRNTKIVDQIQRTATRIEGDVQARIDIGAALTTVPQVESANNTIQFGSPGYTVSEGAGVVSVTLARSGDLSTAATVSYATSDTAGANGCSVTNGAASSRCDYGATAGTALFASGESSKTILIPIVDDAYAEGSETFNVTLSNPSGATIGTQSIATVTITDNDSVNSINPINQPANFVSQHYLDFLGRLPDPGGLAFWQNDVVSCGANAQCAEVKRINVSAAFFLSIEFQESGYLAYRIRKAAFGNPSGVPVPITFNEFLADAQQIANGVVVNAPGWQQKLEENKQSYVARFTMTPKFISLYPLTMSPALFVDTMNQNTGGALSTAERDALVSDLTSGLRTRSEVLRAIAEDPELTNAEFNRAFVLMQYFGYLRRNPNDAPEVTRDFAGYNFWLTKLNQFNGNFVQAEMVKAFLDSTEYRQRFGSP
ncbi:MAG TPA: Calx-beta domain-containing protein, partial [Pyrinomonadaceae bacterium]|nr:Calx-beta domain-containing protein [Pyrinomonadaceae bacterium]